MIAGLLLLSFLTASAVTAVGIGMVGLPLWTGLILFPIIGSATLLAASVLIYAHRAAAQNARPRITRQKRNRTNTPSPETVRATPPSISPFQHRIDVMTSRYRARSFPFQAKPF